MARLSLKKSFLLGVNDVKDRLRAKYTRHHYSWLAGAGAWPIKIFLGLPTENDASADVKVVQEWKQEWRTWKGEGIISWTDRRWSNLGSQHLPERISIATPQQVASWIGESSRWARAEGRYQTIIDRWPALAGATKKIFQVLTDYPDDDFERFIAMLAWLEANPRSDLLVRQIPVVGVHSKWLENKIAVFHGLLKDLRPDGQPNADFHALAGLRQRPLLIRLRVLDTELRAIAGGVSDITVPVEEISRISWPIKTAFIVENLDTGLSFHDFPGAVVFPRKGYDVDVYGGIPWLRNLKRIYYWGDLDTHGFAILNRLRSYLPQAQSFLMNESTLLANKSLWVQESDQAKADNLSFLTDEEHQLYKNLLANRWGDRVRMEQERIPWQCAWETIKGLI